MDDPIQGDHLRSIVERIERLEEEKKTISDDIKEVYAEAKSHGYDVKVLRKAVALRKRDANERAEEEAILDLYMQAIGELADTPLGRASAPGFSSSRQHMARAVPSYPERVSRPAPIAAPDLSTAAQSEGAAGASPEQEASDSAAGNGDRIVAAQGASFVTLSGAGEGPASPVDPASAAEATTFRLPVAKPLRPNCKNPDRCSGYGAKHCHFCVAAVKSEAA